MTDHFGLPTLGLTMAPHPTLSLALLAICVVIQVLDVATTWLALRRGGSEANLVPEKVFAGFGFWPGAIFLKGGVILIALLIHHYIVDDYWFTGVLNLLGVYVLLNNAQALRRN